MSKSTPSEPYLCPLVLSDDWSAVPTRRLVDVVTGLPPGQPTEVRLLWSGDHLRVRIEVTEHTIVSTYQRRDEPVYLSDAVEVFLDPSGLGRTYFEIDLSPHNVLFDALVVNRQRDEDSERDITTLAGWDCDGLVSSTEHTDTGWLAELEIPLSALAPPILPANAEAPLRWRFNIYRVCVSSSGETEYQALYPTGRVDFHRPRSFGELVFVTS